jgi:hypothetical protein
MNQHHDLPQPNEHYTPKWIFDALGLAFDLDVASPQNHKTHVPATAFYTALDDGLSQPWYGRVWCNPPFAKATLWADKFLAHNNGVAIFPNSNSYWVDRMWESDAAIIKLPYKTFYDRPDGTSKRIMYTTYLIAVGDENIAALRASKIGKVR